MDLRLHNYTDINNWLKTYEGKVFRMWVYKRMFTPYEMEQKFTDESVYESSQCEQVIFTEIIPLNDGDYLLGYILAGDYYLDDLKKMPESDLYRQYVKLSEITIAYSEKDNIEFTETP